MEDEIRRFVASLAIPIDRRAVVAAELLDHVACAREAAAREGRDPDAAARAALGDLEAMRRALEAVEPGFGVSRAHAIARGVVASLAIAVLIDRGGEALYGVIGALAAIAIAIAGAPPRALELLRAELRAPRVAGALGRGVPIGPACAYVLTVVSGPFVVWIALIVERAREGVTHLVSPPSAFAVAVAAALLLAVEGVRARRAAA